MKNYNVEGCENFDFKTELLKFLNENDDDTVKEYGKQDKCLITSEPLTEHFVTLKCGHKFNYVPLYNDLINYKSKFMKMDTRNHLGTNQIRCPYCRCKQNNLLEYVNIPSIKKVHGINYIDITISPEKMPNVDHHGFSVIGDPCAYSYGKPLNSIGGYGEYNCYHKYVKIFYGDNKPYCKTHYTKVMNEAVKLEAKKKLKEEKEKLKQEKIAAKLKEKADKIAAKQKEKEEKIKNNVGKKVSKSKIVDVSLNEITNEVVDITMLCKEIIKSGINKGKNCCVKIFENGLCKRHNTLNNNKNKEVDKKVTENKIIEK